jgi:DNA-binding IscR family transcriptional regulator
MHQLVKAGYLESTRGIRGGFRLARPADRVTLYEIASLFMSFDDIGPCFLGL